MRKGTGLYINALRDLIQICYYSPDDDWRKCLLVYMEGTAYTCQSDYHILSYIKFLKSNVNEGFWDKLNYEEFYIILNNSLKDAVLSFDWPSYIKKKTPDSIAEIVSVENYYAPKKIFNAVLSLIFKPLSRNVFISYSKNLYPGLGVSMFRNYMTLKSHGVLLKNRDINDLYEEVGHINEKLCHKVSETSVKKLLVCFNLASEEELFPPKPDSNSRKFVYQGEEFSNLSDFCRKKGINYDRLTYYTRKGHSVEEAVDLYLKKRHVTYSNKEYESYYQLADDLNIDYGALWRLMQTGKSLEEAVKHIKAKQVSYNGVIYKNLNVLCKDLNLNYGTVRYLLKKGVPLDNVIDNLSDKHKVIV